VAVTAFGPPPSELVKLADPRLTITPSQIHGEVLHIDHFGNIITSIGRLEWTGPDTLHLEPQFGRNHDLLPPLLDATRCTVTIGSQTIPAIRQTYGSVRPGVVTALIGSAGQLEIGVNQGSAADCLVASMGDPVTVNMG
jgi:S-adenosylmethionine hydrolase